MKIGNFVDVNQKNLEITLKIPGNLLKNLEKSWKSHVILSVQKSGNPEGRGTGWNSSRTQPRLVGAGGTGWNSSRLVGGCRRQGGTHQGLGQG